MTITLTYGNCCCDDFGVLKKEEEINEKQKEKKKIKEMRETQKLNGNESNFSVIVCVYFLS